eukprot:6474885-Amphidinium_carterae.1
MVRGCAREPILDRSVSLAHLLCAKHSIQMWFEFVDSKSNWSDGISRALGMDEFATSVATDVRRYEVPMHLWAADLSSVLS